MEFSQGSLQPCLSVLKSSFHPLGPTAFFDHIVCINNKMPDQYERDPYYKLIYDTEGPPPLVNLSLDGVDPVDVSKQQPPSPNPPLLPVVGKEVSKRRYLVDDGGLPTALLVDVHVH